MAGSDPRTNRAVGQRPERAEIDSDEDPLIELARIVSEDGGFGLRPEKPRAVQDERSAHVEPRQADSLEDGLEAELMQELETSFARTPRREVSVAPPPREPAPAPPAMQRPAPVRAPAPVRQAAPPPPQDEDDPDPDELLRSIEEQLSQFERRQSSRFTPPLSAGSNSAASPAEESEATPPAAPAFGAPSRGQDERRWQGQRASRIRPFAEDLDAFDAEPQAALPAARDEVVEEPLPTSRAEYRFRGPASAEWDRGRAEPEMAPEPPVEDVYTRPRAEAYREVAPVEPDTEFEAAAEDVEETEEVSPRRRKADARRAARARRREQRAEEAFPEFDDPTPAALPQPDFSGIAANLSRELQSGFPDDNDDKWQDGDATGDESPAPMAAVAPPRRAAVAETPRRGSRAGLLTAAGVILVLLIGGGAAYYLRAADQGPSGPPPVIAADDGAVRVDAQPAQSSSEGETVGEAVYNRVAGNAPPTDEQVVENAEEPKEIARIVLPPSQSETDNPLVRSVGGGEDEPSASETPPAAATGTEPPQGGSAPAASEDEIGPRQVPTFVVRADGTIVSTGDSGAAPDPTPAQSQQLATEAEPIEPTPVPTVAINGANSEASAAPAPTPAPSASTAADLVPRPSIDASESDVEAGSAEEPPAPAEAPAFVAAADPAPPPVVAESGYLVQLSSERTMDQATTAFANAQRRFASVLSKLQPKIQEADLGSKGIYYRVRVGPWQTRDEAIEVCEALKAAGGNCFVTR